MKIPLIVVRDKTSGDEHIVGTDVHDNMYMSEKGGLQYRNLQNGAGTEFGEDGYEFTQLDKYECPLKVHFVSPGEYINKIIEMQADRIRELQIICNDCALKNIPLNPKKETTLVGDYRCPNCNAAFIDGLGKTKYCGNCGQMLDWGEDGG
jgi:ssDNA-binding Zn-finger/Zn-ribbon topoisomerase 1